jgi:3',5'-cyclic AMP phosphodiesterase CpdA
MFRLAHLSDPHLGSLPRPRLHELAGKRALGFFNWLRKRRGLHQEDVLAELIVDMRSFKPDHLAVTGDLINLSLEKEFEPARAWLEALGTPHDVTVVPGNHDAYVGATASHSGKHWGEFMTNDAVQVLVGQEITYPFVRRRGSVALIGLSTAVPTLPFMATGELGLGQLTRFSRLLAELKNEGLFRVVLIHHPPKSTPGQRFRRLVDARDFRAVLAEQGADLVLHGHNHVHSLVWLEGPKGRIPAFGVPSASSPPNGKHDAAGYNIYEIDRAPGGAWHCTAILRALRADGTGFFERARETVS